MSNRAEQTGYMTQFPVKKDVASWRQEEVKIPALGLKTITFSDTRPNMFYLQNTNDIPLFVGITKIPNENSYEWRIEKNNSRTFGRPVPTNTLHILNPANKDITVTLFSVNAPFDIAVLQSFAIDYDVFGDTSFDGIIKGFGANVPLPYGTNHLGTVTVEELPSGTKHIGEVGLESGVINTFNSLLTTMESVKKGIEESNKKVVDFLYFERESVSDAVTLDFTTMTFLPDYINFIANDDENTNLLVTLTLTNGNEKTFTLTKGDIFGDVKMEISKAVIAPKISGSSISWRAMWGKRG